MSPKNEALTRWKASVPAGHCPGCKDKLPPPKPGRGRKERDICAKPSCRKTYLAVRQQGARPPTTLRVIASVVDVEGSRGRVLVTFLPCNHQVELHRSKVGNGDGEKRRKCAPCAAGSPPRAQSTTTQQSRGIR